MVPLPLVLVPLLRCRLASGATGFGTGGMALPRSAEFSLVPSRVLSPRVIVALADASRSCLDVGLHGQIVAIASCASGALGFASAAVANVFFADG